MSDPESARAVLAQRRDLLADQLAGVKLQIAAVEREYERRLRELNEHADRINEEHEAVNQAIRLLDHNAAATPVPATTTH